MNRNTLSKLIMVVLVVLIGILAFPDKAKSVKLYQAFPGNGFTYQGQLVQNGRALDGHCDFQFSLWRDVSSGDQVGDRLPIADVKVSKGYFTIPSLDFGDDAFNGEERWLEIEVKCAGENQYTRLSPRQPISPAPMALSLPGLYTRQNETSPNVIGGYPGNIIGKGIYGSVIGGGGAGNSLNRISDHYGIIAGGSGNQTGNFDEIPSNASYGVVSGGDNNAASSAYATVGGGQNNTSSSTYATVSGGQSNNASSTHSFVGGGSNNTASGTYAFIGGGDGNTASGAASVVDGGNENTAMGTASAISGGENNNVQGQNAVIAGGAGNLVSGQFASVGGGQSNHAIEDYASISGGYQAEARLYGQTAYASGSFNENGDAQYATYILRNVTSNTAATELFLDGISSRLTLPVNHTMVFEIVIAARRDAHNQSAGYYFRGVIKNDDGETSFVQSPDTVTLGEDTPVWNVTLNASNTYDALVIQVSGEENATIRWVATVRAVEVAW